MLSPNQVSGGMRMSKWFLVKVNGDIAVEATDKADAIRKAREHCERERIIGDVPVTDNVEVKDLGPSE